MSALDKVKNNDINRVASLHSIYQTTSSQHGSHATLQSLDKHDVVFTPNQGLLLKKKTTNVNNVHGNSEEQDYDHDDHHEEEDYEYNDEDGLQFNWQTVVSTNNDVSLPGNVNK